MMMSFILTMRNSCCALPARRWVIVASFRCAPVAHALRSRGEALSMWCTMVRSWKVALPAPLPPPPGETDAEFVTPHENESTSISSLCLSSSDSPLMSPIFAKISDVIWTLLGGCRGAEPAANEDPIGGSAYQMSIDSGQQPVTSLDRGPWYPKFDAVLRQYLIRLSQRFP